MMADTNPTTITEQMDEKTMKKKTINNLDDDSLLLILSLLNIRDKTRCERVCQRWNHLIMHSWASTKSLTFKESFCLWVDGQDIDVVTLTKILKKCPNLQIINLEQTATAFDEKICDIIGQHCPELEKLIIRDTDLNRYSVSTMGKACSKLKSIDFGKCNGISEKSLWELFHSRNDMEYIALSQVPNITGKCFYLLTALSYLDLSGCLSIVTDAFSKLGQNCSQTLKTLLAPPLNNEGLKIICTTFVNLEVFQVETSSQVPLSGARLLGNLGKLRVLRFWPELLDLDNGALLSIMKKCPDLTELSLFGTDKLTDLSVANLAKYCLNLRELSLEGSKISDDSARALAHLKKLAVLKIAGSLITDEGAMYILTHCTSLEVFSINQCLGINLKTLQYAWDLVDQGLASKELTIEYNYNRLRVNSFASREECNNFEGTEIWASDEEDRYSADEEDDEYIDYGYGNYDYIVDGDLESEEELT